ncbi:hypothetical protein CW714_07610 [Methanophagales archaeon]|nr:MAG: hypothetical protein CW714_07610 [Methanophagales archaeon]
MFFFAGLLDCKVKDLLAFLRKDKFWKCIICGTDPVPRPGDISNFKRRVGEKRPIYCFPALTEQITSCMNFDDPEKLEQLNEGLVKRFWGHRRRKKQV